jgi:hypothetical protein
MALADILIDHPVKAAFDLAELQQACRACLDCAVACTAWSDSDRSRNSSTLSECIRLCIDCAEVCAATASVLCRPSPRWSPWEKLVLACMAICAECARECSSHEHVSCDECAQACRSAEQALAHLLALAQK